MTGPSGQGLDLILNFVKSLSLLILPVLARVAFGQTYTSEVDKFVQEAMRARHVPGMSIAVVRDGKVEYAKGYGLADLEKKVAATPSTVYKVGSVSKQFTSTIILQLMNKGKLKLEDPVGKFLKEAPAAWKDVTIWHLLTHTSGIKSYTSMDDFGSRVNTKVDRKKFMAYIGPQAMDFVPGEQWRYNNSGYFLLGLIIEEITKEPLARVLEGSIFKPLHMDSTRLIASGEKIKGLAQGYDPTLTGSKVTEPMDMSWPYAAGSIVSTVEDLAKWDAALYNASILPQQTWELAWKPVMTTKGASTLYGFGWSIEQLGKTLLIGHGGDIPGFNADIVRLPSKKLTVIALCNLDPGITTKVTREIAGIVDSELKVEKPKPVEDKQPELTAKDRTLLDQLRAGTAKADDFSEPLGKLLFPDQYKELAAQLKALGSVKSMTLIREMAGKGNQLRHYQLEFDNATIRLIVGRSTDGKVSALNLGPG